MVAFRLFSRGLGLVGTLVVARLLTPTDFGIVAIVSTITAAINSATETGVQDLILRLKETPDSLYDTAFSIKIVRAVVSGLILMVLSQMISSWFPHHEMAQILLVMAVVYTIGGFENIKVVEFRKRMLFNLEFMLSSIPRISGFLGTLISAILLRSYWALIIGITVTKLTRLVVTYCLHPYRPKFGFSHWRELAGFTFWTWMSALAYIV